jgi:hypothetical protein
MKLSEYTLHRQFGDKKGNLSQCKWSHLQQTSQKLLKPSGLTQGTIQVFTDPSIRRHILAKAFYYVKTDYF